MDARQPDMVALERELGRRSLRTYLEMVWPLIEPARPFVANWHHDVICDHLEALSRREFTRLCINIPPGCTKSILCSVVWPTWTWTYRPSEKWITASYSERIARRDAMRSRAVLMSPWWRQRWGDMWQPNPHAWTTAEYRNSEAGFRFAVTVGGGVTGEHADAQLVDDPIKPLDARGARVDTVGLESCREWWDETMATRVVDPATTVRCIIMQRLHERDLSAHVLGTGTYVHLNLPMEYEGRCVITVPHACSVPKDDQGQELEPTPLGFRDGRKEGDLLWPAKFPADVLPIRREELGSRATAAQDQQRPVPAGGGVFKRDWVQHWTHFPKGSGVQWLQSWDCAFKGTADSDWVVGQVWVRKQAEYYLVDQVRDRMTFTETCKAIVALSAKWPKAVRKLVEDKANGSAVIDVLRKKVSGLVPITPEGGKLARAHAIEPLWEARNVYIPDPQRAPWVHDFVQELVGFTGDEGRPDDQVDGMTQALVYLHAKSAGTYLNALRKLRQELG
jgi:predicted phage terminase large subunit-like protein